MDVLHCCIRGIERSQGWKYLLSKIEKCWRTDDSEHLVLCILSNDNCKIWRKRAKNIVEGVWTILFFYHYLMQVAYLVLYEE